MRLLELIFQLNTTIEWEEERIWVFGFCDAPVEYFETLTKAQPRREENQTSCMELEHANLNFHAFKATSGRINEYSKDSNVISNVK